MNTETMAVAEAISASVVLCTRDRADRLPIALESLAAMQLPAGTGWECLVVDNSSRDKTREVVESFIAAGHPQFRYVYEPEPGKTYALNTGIAAARGGILAFTDDDAVVAKNWLAATLDAFETFGADGVGGKVLPIWQAPRPAWLADDLLNVLALLDLGEQAFQIDWSREPRMLYGVNYAFRKSVFQTLGNFNTILGSRGEDQELFDRLAAARARIYYDPKIVVQHIIPGDRLTQDYYRNWYRATGVARAKLGTVGREIFGIPLHTIRQGLKNYMQLLRALATGDRAGAFRCRLRALYYFAFYKSRIRGMRAAPG